MDFETITKLIYEAARKEAEWSKRPIIPEPWEDRDNAFKKQMVDVVRKYIESDKLPSPEEAHNSWMKAYLNMGWKYGEVRDAEKKTHPDLVPFYELPKDERDKDAIFLSLVWLVKSLLNNVTRGIYF
jgi:hypothetical protein